MSGDRVATNHPTNQVARQWSSRVMGTGEWKTCLASDKYIRDEPSQPWTFESLNTLISTLDVKSLNTLITAMFSSNRIQNSVYNSLRAIETQPLMLVDILFDIGHIFVNYGVNKDVGISLLHRHFELKDEEVMIHNGLRCSPALPGYVHTNLSHPFVS